MRETIHLVSRRDYPLLAAGIRTSGQEWWRRVNKIGLDVDMRAFARRARRFLRGAERSRAEIEEFLRANDFPRASLWGFSHWLDLVRVPPVGNVGAAPCAHVRARGRVGGAARCERGGRNRAARAPVSRRLRAGVEERPLELVQGAARRSSIPFSSALRFGASATSKERSCSICRGHRSPTRRRLRPCGSSPRGTRCSSCTRGGPGSSRRSTGRACSRRRPRTRWGHFCRRRGRGNVEVRPREGQRRASSGASTRALVERFARKPTASRTSMLSPVSSSSCAGRRSRARSRER